MDRDLKKEQQYLKAVKKVKAIRGFYIHLAAFIIISIAMAIVTALYINPYNRELFIWLVLSVFISWLVGIIIHSVCVFGSRIIFSKNWEERKLEEFIEEENDKIWE